MLNSPSLVNFVHVKRIAPACYEARLKFQNVVLTGGPLYGFIQTFGYFHKAFIIWGIKSYKSAYK